MAGLFDYSSGHNYATFTTPELCTAFADGQLNRQCGRYWARSLVHVLPLASLHRTTGDAPSIPTTLSIPSSRLNKINANEYDYVYVIVFQLLNAQWVDDKSTGKRRKVTPTGAPTHRAYEWGYIHISWLHCMLDAETQTVRIHRHECVSELSLTREYSHRIARVVGPLYTPYQCWQVGTNALQLNLHPRLFVDALVARLTLYAFLEHRTMHELPDSLVEVARLTTRSGATLDLLGFVLGMLIFTRDRRHGFPLITEDCMKQWRARERMLLEYRARCGVTTPLRFSGIEQHTAEELVTQWGESVRKVLYESPFQSEDVDHMTFLVSRRFEDFPRAIALRRAYLIRGMVMAPYQYRLEPLLNRFQSGFQACEAWFRRRPGVFFRNHPNYLLYMMFAYQFGQHRVIGTPPEQSIDEGQLMGGAVSRWTRNRVAVSSQSVKSLRAIAPSCIHQMIHRLQHGSRKSHLLYPQRLRTFTTLVQSGLAVPDIEDLIQVGATKIYGVSTSETTKRSLIAEMKWVAKKETGEIQMSCRRLQGVGLCPMGTSRRCADQLSQRLNGETVVDMYYPSYFIRRVVHSSHQ